LRKIFYLLGFSIWWNCFSSVGLFQSVGIFFYPRLKMQNKILMIIIVLFVISSLKSVAQLSEEDKQKIEQAIPKKAMVQPEKPRKMLLVTLNMRDGQMRKGHPSILYGNYAIELMGQQTGAYETVFSNDTLMFLPENLQQFDAICFNNTAGVLFESPELRQSLLDFVAQGKGFIGIHAAGATFVQWPRYDQWPAFGVMLGGYENGGHPWKPHETITLHVEDAMHPLTRAFKQSDFEISDEVFQFQAPYTRDSLRVLLTINTDLTDMSEDRYILPERRADLDLAISWIRNYGQGRVFYSSLGHNNHIFWNEPVLSHFLAGFQFSLGDLKAVSSPSNRLKKALNE